jgi:anti-sigma B factor antagonist
LEFYIDRRDDGSAVVRLVGRLDLLSSLDVKKQLVEAVAAGFRRQVVDLGEVTFIDSSGLGALIGGLKAARIAGGDLRIARPGEQARLVFQLTTLDRVLHLFPTVDEALVGF